MYIFSSPSGLPSARALASGLRTELGKSIICTSQPTRLKEAPVIRWGNSTNLSFNQSTEYNSQSAIRTASNKVILSNLLSEKEVPCIEIISGTPQHFPVIVRTILQGSGGDGIVLCKTPEEFYQYRQYPWSYWRNLYPELGVHIFNGKILKVFKKIREGGLEREEFPIRNMSRGYHFSRVTVEKYPKLSPIIEKFFSVFPIKFGRLDIGWDIDNKVYRVIEMNSAPGIADNIDTLNLYIKSFKEVL